MTHKIVNRCGFRIEISVIKSTAINPIGSIL